MTWFHTSPIENTPFLWWQWIIQRYKISAAWFHDILLFEVDFQQFFKHNFSSFMNVIRLIHNYVHYVHAKMMILKRSSGGGKIKKLQTSKKHLIAFWNFLKLDRCFHRHRRFLVEFLPLKLNWTKKLEVGILIQV